MKLKISASTLKWIAIITMIIDHTGAVLFSEIGEHPSYIIFRIIGRIAFPIFAYLIVEGYRHTKSVKKYAIRLLVFAFVSEIPFDLAFEKEMFNYSHQNVFFTLAIGLIALWVFDKIKEKNSFLAILAVYVLGVLAQALQTDYGIFGVLLIFCLYSTKTKLYSYVWIAVINIIMVFLYGGLLQGFAILSIPFIAMYNGQKGRQSKILQYSFYIIYPAHILLLYLLYQVL